jgi:hypothetical protein
MPAATSIDLLLLCGARPQLLKQTLESFQKKVFPNFSIANVFANVDPFQGGQTEVTQVSAIIRDYFPSAKIREPRTPSFTGAVRWLWASTSSPYCLHLEDDWIAEEGISEAMIFPHFIENVAQVSLLTAEKSWRFKHPYHCQWERKRFLGISVSKRLLEHEPVFTTSPSFLRGEFANVCASLMVDSLDPEKQLYNDQNKELREFTKNFRNRLVSGENGFPIRDTGRAYRKEAGLIKLMENGQSIWRTSGDP